MISNLISDISLIVQDFFGVKFRTTKVRKTLVLVCKVLVFVSVGLNGCMGLIASGREVSYAFSSYYL
jgi:hypothetical protein